MERRGGRGGPSRGGSRGRGSSFGDRGLVPFKLQFILSG